MRTPLVTSVVLAAAVTLAGCGGDPEPTSATVETTAPATSTAPAEATVRRAVSAVSGALTVRRRPSADAAVLTRLPATTPLGSPRVLLVESVTEGWVRVALPIRPNGSRGWVAADDVRLEPVSGKVLVDLTARRLRYLVDGEEVVATPIAVGTRQNPTPTGRFYVTDRVKPEDPGGAYGVFALGLSAHSDTLTEFGGGDGQVGIHGTNESASIGRAASHGCVRVPNKVAAVLTGVTLGTPVVVT